MNARVFFRIASVLIFLFALGHTVGFRQVDPRWGVSAVVAGMQGTRFPVQGFVRSYWDFFAGFGLFVSVFLFLSSWLSWQLGRMAGQNAAGIRSIAWALALCFGLVVLLNVRYFFMTPVVFSLIIFLLLTAAASLTGKTRS